MPSPRTDALGRSMRWRLRLTEAVVQFIERAVRSPQTATSYKSDLHLFCDWLNSQAGAGWDSVQKFTTSNLLEYLASLRHRGLKESTRHRRLATFRKFSKWGRLNGYWKEDPAASVEGVPRPKRLPRPFTKDETTRLLALPLPAKENALRAVLFFSGLRATAASHLRVQDVSVDPPRIRYIAKGGRECIIVMHARLKDILWDYLGTHTDMKGPSYIFLNSWKRPLSRRSLELMTAEWGRAAVVPFCLPHRFRHTFGTDLLRRTKNLKLVQEGLGHADIGSTVIYTQVVAAELEQGIAQLYGDILPNNNPESTTQ